MLYRYANVKYENVNDFRDGDDPLKVIEEQVVYEQQSKYKNYVIYDCRCLMRYLNGYRVWRLRLCEWQTTRWWESVKHLTKREPSVDIDDELEHYDENDNFIDYDNSYYCMDHNRYELRKITKQIRTKKFICEAPIGSSKSTSIRKWNLLNRT